MKTDPLDQYAPWPQTASDATATAMVRYALVRARGAEALYEAGYDVDRQLVRSTANYAIAELLRAAQRADPHEADRVARMLWDRLGDGAMASEWVHDRLDGLGLDPGVIGRASVAAYERRAAEVTP